MCCVMYDLCCNMYVLRHVWPVLHHIWHALHHVWHVLRHVLPVLHNVRHALFMCNMYCVMFDMLHHVWHVLCHVLHVLHHVRRALFMCDMYCVMFGNVLMKYPTAFEKSISCCAKLFCCLEAAPRKVQLGKESPLHLRLSPSLLPFNCACFCYCTAGDLNASGLPYMSLLNL